MAIAAKRSVPVKRSVKAQEVTENPPGTGTQFGVIIEISGQTIALSGGMISDAKANGLEFNVPDPVKLGPLSDIVFMDFKLSSVIADLPELLKKPVQTIADMVWTVERAHVKVPGSADKTGKGVQFTIAMNGQFSSAIKLGPLSIVGIVFGASNEAPAKP